MGFVDVVFPVVDAGSGSSFMRDIKTVKPDSGQIYKLVRNQLPSAIFNLRAAGRSQEDLDEISDFYQAVGPENTFRYWNPRDHSSAADHRSNPDRLDVQVGVGDGVNRRFQIVKQYSYGGEIRTRPIRRVRAGTLVVAVDDVIVSNYVEVLGELIFDLGSEPAVDAAVTCGFEHDYECSIDQSEGDVITFELAAYTSGRVAGDIILVEHRDPETAPPFQRAPGAKEHGDVASSISVLLTDGHFHTLTATADVDILIEDPNTLPAGDGLFTFKNRGGSAANIKHVGDLATTIKTITAVGDEWAKLAISRDPVTGLQSWEAMS